MALTFLAGGRRDSGRIGFLGTGWCFQPRQTQINDLLSQGMIPDDNPFQIGYPQEIQIDDEVDEGKDLPVTLPTEWANGSAERVMRATNAAVRSSSRFRFTFSFIQLFLVGRNG